MDELDFFIKNVFLFVLIFFGIERKCVREKKQLLFFYFLILIVILKMYVYLFSKLMKWEEIKIWEY